MTYRRAAKLQAILMIPVSTALKTQLELEAWECQQTLAEYIRGLLSRRTLKKRAQPATVRLVTEPRSPNSKAAYHE